MVDGKRPFPSTRDIYMYPAYLLTILLIHPSTALISLQNRQNQKRRGVGLLPASIKNTSDVEKGGGEKVELKHLRRVFAISDLHTDSVVNMSWLTERCKTSALLTPGPNDALIVAGDISHDLELLERTLSTLVSGLKCHVFFVPGNHEAWIGGQEMDKLGLTSSLDKLDMVTEICNKLGVLTTHELVGGANRSPVWIVPILGWYDGSLALPGCHDLCDDFGRWPWVDFLRCEWGAEFDGRQLRREGDATVVEKIPGYERIPFGLTESMLRKNVGAVGEIREHFEEHVQTLSRASRLRVMEGLSPSPPPGLVTFSHFLPSKRTLPDWKDPASDNFQRDEWLNHPVPEVSAKFAYVAGSDLIDRQIRSIVPPGLHSSSTSTGVRHIHVFGHSHRPKDFRHNYVRYVHNPVGKPVEREMNMVDPNFDFQLLWDTMSKEGEVNGETIIRYWEEKGGGVERLAENMARRKRSRRKKAGKRRDVPKAKKPNTT